MDLESGSSAPDATVELFRGGVRPGARYPETEDIQNGHGHVEADDRVSCLFATQTGNSKYFECAQGQDVEGSSEGEERTSLHFRKVRFEREAAYAEVDAGIPLILFMMLACEVIDNRPGFFAGIPDRLKNTW